MEQQQVLADLEYAKTLAEDGVKSPLVGGRFGLMWGVLLVITFTVQWAFLSGTVELPQHYLGFLWLGFGVVGGIGTFLLDRSLRDKPGLRSVGNRLDNAIWLFFSLAMAACFVGLLVYMSTRGADYPMFDTMVAIGFAGQGMAYGTLSQVTGQRWM
ncbi:MAG: hypothetical protein KJO55_03670, partial [Gammaproteobacteria bacterium]|nr:hypothetical protein [Gammaproteobacteria bacterium]